MTPGTGTHLSTSLKDLQKLGVDAVSIVGDLDGNAATVNSISLDLGSGLQINPDGSIAPMFGDTNNDGTISAAEDRALNVTLDAQYDQLLDITSNNNAQLLNASGIDNINLSVGNRKANLHAVTEDAQQPSGV
jgi:hypothetical protein